MVEVSSVVGRLTILENGPVISPAACGLCGFGGSERKYLDLRLDFEFYGTLIFCDECLMSMAQMLGFITPDQAQALEARVEEAERELIQSRSLLQSLGSLRVSLDALGIGAGDSTPDVDVSVDQVDESDEGSADADTPESDSVSDDEQPDADESGDESGPDDSSESDTTNKSRLLEL